MIFRGHRGRGAAPGMTIMEMMIVAVVMGLVMTGAVVGLGAITGQRLTTSTVKISAAVRSAYSRSATTGKTVRIVFDFESATFWMEEADGGRVLLSRDGEDEDEEEDEEAQEDGVGGGESNSATAQAGLLAGVLGEDPSQLLAAAQGAFEADSQNTDTNMDMVSALGNLSQSGLDIPTPRYKVPRFERTEGRLGKAIRLESGVMFESIATEHRERPADEGRAYVYFFPGGVAELAVIQLRDSRGHVHSVEIHPLTGRTKIHAVPYEMPTSEEDINEAGEAY